VKRPIFVNVDFSRLRFKTVLNVQHNLTRLADTERRAFAVKSIYKNNNDSRVRRDCSFRVHFDLKRHVLVPLA